MTTTARERTIEDILAQYPTIAARLLDRPPENLVLADRQRKVPSGRTDLLFLSGQELLVVELKIEAARRPHLDQVLGYADDLQGTDFAGTSQPIPVLLAPEVPADVEPAAANQGVTTFQYDVDAVLSAFNDRLTEAIASFEKPPVLTSTGSLHYINGLIDALGERPQTVETLATRSDVFKDTGHKQPEDRLRKFGRLGVRLQLVTVTGTSYRQGVSSLRLTGNSELALTDRGLEYEAMLDTGGDRWMITDKQAGLLVGLLYDRPFFSGVTHGLLLLLDSIFELSKNTTPVSRSALIDWYPRKAGKHFEWSEGARTRKNAVDWFGSYLDELGLVTAVDNGYYLSPEGFQLLAYHYIDVGKALVRT
jgi:hypothetical protein